MNTLGLVSLVSEAAVLWFINDADFHMFLKLSRACVAAIPSSARGSTRRRIQPDTNPLSGKLVVFSSVLATCSASGTFPFACSVATAAS